MFRRGENRQLCLQLISAVRNGGLGREGIGIIMMTQLVQLVQLVLLYVLIPESLAGNGSLCHSIYFSFRLSRLNVSPSETKTDPDR